MSGEPFKLTSEAAKELSQLGASKGGKARAESLTSKRRSEIARTAVEARWRKEGKLTEVPQATHGSPDSPLRIGNLMIPAYVLSDGRRVLAQVGMLRCAWNDARRLQQKAETELPNLLSQDQT